MHICKYAKYAKDRRGCIYMHIGKYCKYAKYSNMLNMLTIEGDAKYAKYRRNMLYMLNIEGRRGCNIYAYYMQIC